MSAAPHAAPACSSPPRTKQQQDLCSRNPLSSSRMLPASDTTLYTRIKPCVPQAVPSFHCVFSWSGCKLANRSASQTGLPPAFTISQVCRNSTLAPIMAAIQLLSRLLPAPFPRAVVGSRFTAAAAAAAPRPALLLPPLSPSQASLQAYHHPMHSLSTNGFAAMAATTPHSSSLIYQADQAFKQGDYAAAEELYKRLVGSPGGGV